MVNAKASCHDIMCKLIPGSPPLFLFFIGVRGEPRNKATFVAYMRRHSTVSFIAATSVAPSLYILDWYR